MQIKTGRPIEPLSAEHITACTPNALECGGSGGCQGAVPQLAFTYTQLFGLTTEKDYPYSSGMVSAQLGLPNSHCELHTIFAVWPN